MKIQIFLTLFLIPVIYSCKSQKALKIENEQLKEVIVTQKESISKLVKLEKESIDLMKNLKLYITDLDTLTNRLKMENSILRSQIEEMNAKFEKAGVPLLGALMVTGIDTVNKKNNKPVETNRVGQFQYFKLSFTIFSNPAILNIREDWVWVTLEDSLKNEIPIRILSKQAVERGNAGGYSIISDGEMHLVRLYFTTKSQSALKPGHYQIYLKTNDRLACSYNLILE